MIDEKYYSFQGEKSLLCGDRVYKSYNNSNINPRLASHEDEVRITSSSAFRRLQDKAQLYPLEKMDYARTRLTHSLEVAAISSDVATEVLKLLVENHLVESIESLLDLSNNLSSYARNAGLWHDIGNPPFGHFGEETIHLFFEQYLKTIPSKHLTLDGKTISGKYSLEEILKAIPNDQAINDLVCFDGNVQSFRYAVKLQDNGSSSPLGLSFGTLGAIIKYPYSSVDGNNKYGYYLTEKNTIDELSQRHIIKDKASCNPIALIMESGDDIGNVIADIEDGLKKGKISETHFCDAIIKEFNTYNKLLEAINTCFDVVDGKVTNSNNDIMACIDSFVTKTYCICPNSIQKDLFLLSKIDDSSSVIIAKRIISKIFKTQKLLSKFIDNLSSNYIDDRSVEIKKYTINMLTNEQSLPKTNAVNSLISKEKQYHRSLYSWLHGLKGHFISSCAQTFVHNYSDIMNASYFHKTVDKKGNIISKRVDLIGDSNCSYMYDFLRGFIKQFIYTDSEKTIGEIEGGNIIAFLLKTFCDAIQNVQLVKDGKRDDEWRLKDTNKDSKTILLLSKNFIDIFYDDYNTLINSAQTNDEKLAIELYLKFRLVTDYVAGATDSYAKHLYSKLTGIS